MSDKELSPQERVWAEIDKHKKNPQPTAPCGTTVRWHHSGVDSNENPAIVVSSENEPGRVALLVGTKTGWQYKPGVYFHKHWLNNGNNATIKSNGTWSYKKGETPAKDHYDDFNKYIAHRERAQKNAEAIAAETEAAMKAKREELVGAK